jgi:HSP20 family protein
MMGSVARIFLERSDFDDFPRSGEADPVEYRPRVDVIETAQAVEIVADLPGVSADAVQVSISAGTVMVSGVKHAPFCAHREAAFHLAERTFGRFTCLVRCDAAIDAGRAHATLEAGELHIILPRIDDRRGAMRVIPVTAAGADVS